MQDYQQRVIDEKAELDSKIVKLTQFIFSDQIQAVEKSEQQRMEEQLYCMMRYSYVLRDRINCFSN